MVDSRQIVFCIWPQPLRPVELKMSLIKEIANALNNLRNTTDPVVAGHGDFDHARRIHPSVADHRHGGGVAQSDSGKTANLVLCPVP